MNATLWGRVFCGPFCLFDALYRYREQVRGWLAVESTACRSPQPAFPAGMSLQKAAEARGRREMSPREGHRAQPQLHLGPLIPVSLEPDLTFPLA